MMFTWKSACLPLEIYYVSLNLPWAKGHCYFIYSDCLLKFISTLKWEKCLCISHLGIQRTYSLSMWGSIHTWFMSLHVREWGLLVCCSENHQLPLLSSLYNINIYQSKPGIVTYSQNFKYYLYINGSFTHRREHNKLKRLCKSKVALFISGAFDAMWSTGWNCWFLSWTLFMTNTQQVFKNVFVE